MFDIVGMGNAMVDITTAAQANQSFLRLNPKVSGGFFRTDQKDFEAILQDCQSPIMSAGGSVANSMKAFSALGGRACFMGQVGDDVYGRFWSDELQKYGVVACLRVGKQKKTGCSIVLVDEQGEKSICAKTNVAKIVAYDSLAMNFVKRAKMLFVEGYWLDHNRETVEKVMDYALEAKVKTAFTLSDPLIVEKNQSFFEAYANKIDVLLGNDREFKALKCATFSPLKVKTCGENGVEVEYCGQQKHYQALPVGKVVNTTGAGDAFAGGFLYALTQQSSLDEAVRLGQLCSQDVLQSEGAVVSLNIRQQLQKQDKSLAIWKDRNTFCR